MKAMKDNIVRKLRGHNIDAEAALLLPRGEASASRHTSLDRSNALDCHRPR